MSLVRRLGSVHSHISLPDDVSTTTASSSQQGAPLVRQFLSADALRNAAARIGLLTVPLSIILIIVYPLLLTVDSRSLSDSLDQCEEFRSILYVPKERMRFVVVRDLPADLPSAASLTQESAPGRDRWLYVGEGDAAWWHAQGLTGEWVLAFIARGEHATFTSAWEHHDFFPRREDCEMGWPGATCSMASLLDMHPAGVLSYINGTVREQLPATFVFSRPLDDRPFHATVLSHYLAVVLAAVVTVVGVGLVSVAQLRGRMTSHIDRVVLKYFFVAWVSTTPGGIGYMAWVCTTPKAHSFILYPLLFVVVAYGALLTSNIQLQWILVYKIEVVEGARQNKRLRRALLVEHAALLITVLNQTMFVGAFMFGHAGIQNLGLAMTNVMLVFVALADFAFSAFAIAAYTAPLMSVRRSLAEARTNRSSGTDGSGGADLRNLRKAYRVTLMNVAASVLAVFSTTTSYGMMLVFLLCMMRRDTPWIVYEFGMRVQIFDSILNDICTIIFADLFYLVGSCGGGTDQRTLWAIAQVGVHAALRQQQHDSQHERLTRMLATLAKGRNAELSKRMAHLEGQLRLASLERFRSGDVREAEHVFRAMQTLARAELCRLMELVRKIIQLYQEASTRFDCLLEIGHRCHECRQPLPRRLAESCRDKAGVDDNAAVVDYLYGYADVVAPKFIARVSALVDAFNAAQRPEELGLDPEDFHFRIFAAQGVRARQVLGPKKTKERGWEKIRLDYADREFPQACCLLDVERTLLTFPDPYALAVFYAFLVQERSLPVVRVKNRFLGQEGVTGEHTSEEFECKDVLVNVMVDDMIVEIQLALENLSELKSCMHPYYRLKRANRFQDLWAQSIFSKRHDKAQRARAGNPISCTADDDHRSSQRTAPAGKADEVELDMILPGEILK